MNGYSFRLRQRRVPGRRSPLHGSGAARREDASPAPVFPASARTEAFAQMTRDVTIAEPTSLTPPFGRGLLALVTETVQRGNRQELAGRPRAVAGHHRQLAFMGATGTRPRAKKCPGSVSSLIR